MQKCRQPVWMPWIGAWLLMGCTTIKKCQCLSMRGSSGVIWVPEQSAETMHPLQRAKIIPKTAQPVSPPGADIFTPDLILALKPSLYFRDADSYTCREKNNITVKLPRISTEECSLRFESFNSQSRNLLLFKVGILLDWVCTSCSPSPNAIGRISA